MAAHAKMSKSKMKFAIRDGGTTNDNTPTKNHIDECAAIFSIELGVGIPR